MSSPGIDILAIEPYYTGARRLMLETLARRSRHRWTILKLPGKRIERRLEVAAQWFAEVILRRPPIKFDLLFTSEAINLPDLYQLCPELGGRPVVAYFHDNQLPLPGRGVARRVDHVNLLTAVEASEIWFNSLHHMRTFLGRAGVITRQMSHYFDPDAMSRITSRSSLVHPPVELDSICNVEAATGFQRRKQALFVDLRNADTRLLSDALKVLHARGEVFELVTVGPRGDLPATLARKIIPESDEEGITFALAHCGIYVSTQTDATFDPRALMSLCSGLRVVVPETGVYPELVPPPFRSAYLYQPHPEFLASAIQDAWNLPAVASRNGELREGLGPYEAEQAVTTVDLRLQTLVTHFRSEYGRSED